MHTYSCNILLYKLLVSSSYSITYPLPQTFVYVALFVTPSNDQRNIEIRGNGRMASGHFWMHFNAIIPITCDMGCLIPSWIIWTTLFGNINVSRWLLISQIDFYSLHWIWITWIVSLSLKPIFGKCGRCATFWNPLILSFSTVFARWKNPSGICITDTRAKRQHFTCSVVVVDLIVYLFTRHAHCARLQLQPWIKITITSAPTAIF